MPPKKKAGGKGKAKRKQKVVEVLPTLPPPPTITVHMQLVTWEHLNITITDVPLTTTLLSLTHIIMKKHGGAITGVKLYKNGVVSEKSRLPNLLATLRELGLTGEMVYAKIPRKEASPVENIESTEPMAPTDPAQPSPQPAAKDVQSQESQEPKEKKTDGFFSDMLDFTPPVVPETTEPQDVEENQENIEEEKGEGRMELTLLYDFEPRNAKDDVLLFAKIELHPGKQDRDIARLVRQQEEPVYRYEDPVAAQYLT